MSENTNSFSPAKLLNKAVRTVKGENTNRLIEDFTSEMTLVAEGLYEDQGKLHHEISELAREEDARLQHIETELASLDTTLEEERRNNDEIVTELRNRLAALEKQNKTLLSGAAKKEKKSWIAQLTVPVAIIAGAWVLVTVLKLIGGGL
ncbi:MAG: hypothetical protein Q4G19_08235 [Clostridia bacterium]|nr:hypothetical protein [Clostridia bacterium]